MKVKYAISTLVLTLSVAYAQTDNKAPVYVGCYGSDSIGERLCTALRDGIASSPRYYETTNRPGYYFEVDVLSANPDFSKSISAQSVVLTANHGGNAYFVDSWLYITGSDKVDSQAEAILASVDGDVQKWR